MVDRSRSADIENFGAEASGGGEWNGSYRLSSWNDERENSRRDYKRPALASG